jgi:hypothetical protein
MLMEVPSGTTRDVILLETLAFFSTHSIVMGRVAEEELVENAVRIAGPIALKCHQGLTLPIKKRSRGKIIQE